ncbi:MAG: type II secretion system protein [Patescibacteria group bacterium]|nr:type II secretion system protein [Patescibacteria group bacterium]
MPKKKRNKQAGFTLVELLVAVAIFAVFITISSSSLVNVLKIEQKANVLRQTQTGARYILETMAREARSANGELNAAGERITHAYGFASYATYSQLYIYSTDLSAKRVTRVIYIYYFSTYTDPLKRNTISKNINYKTIGGSYGATPEIASLNDPDDLKITAFSCVTNPNASDFSIPPKLLITIQAQSGQGAGAIKEEYRATVDLTTSVTPRNY